jgi:hypothetical protein
MRSMATRKSWHDKLTNFKNLPQVKPIPAAMQKRLGKGTIAIPSPIEVDALIRKIPKRRVATMAQLGAAVAKQHRATVGCTITTGIFAWIAAHAADEAERAGIRKITPYWRALKAGGELNPKYPGGIANLKHRLEAEGHVVVARRARWFVQDFERKLAPF